MQNPQKRPSMWILLLVGSFAAALLLWYFKFEPEFSPKMTLILMLAAALLLLPLYRAMRQSRDAQSGIPLEDELIRERRLLAGARAFHLSFYLWLTIFVFNSVFSDREEMLGIGILGSAALYGVCWFQLKLRGHERED